MTSSDRAAFAVCASCRKPLAPGAKFCRFCGEIAVAAEPAEPDNPTALAEIDDGRPPQPADLPATLGIDDGPTPPPADPPAMSGYGYLGSWSRTQKLIAGVAAALASGGIVVAIALSGAGSSDGDASSGATGAPTGARRGYGAIPDEPSSVEPPSAFADRVADGYPAKSDEEIARDARQVLLSFHRALVDHDFKAAWARLSDRKRDQVRREDGYRAWKQAQGSLTPYLEPTGIEVSMDALESDGVARVSVTGMKWTQPGSPCEEWSGLTWVKYEDGAWYYDPGYSTTGERERHWKRRFDELLGANC